MGGDIYFPYSPGKSDFLKSASLVVGDSKAWLGINETPRELSFGNKIIQGELVTGNTVLFDNIEWIVCDTDYNKGFAYLASYEIIQQVSFNPSATNKNLNYVDSNLRKVAKEFEDNMSPEALEQVIPITTSGVTSKVFIPTKDQIESGFEYFITDTHRVCAYNNKADNYWLSSIYYKEQYTKPFSISCVDSSGMLNDLDPYYDLGFRPFICVKMDTLLYEYSITVNDKNGNVVPNITIYDKYDTKLGVTNNNGTIKFMYPIDIVTIKSKTTQNGYYVNETINGILNSVSTSIISATSVYSGILGIGNIIHFCNNDWLVCHIDDNKYYLAATTILENTRFGNNNKYNGSTLASRAMVYQNTLSSQYPDIVPNYLNNVTVEGVTAKVFSLTYNQMRNENGAEDVLFNYFGNDGDRRCKFNNKYSPYWLSSNKDYNSSYYISDIGSTTYSSDPSSDIYGFRPCICITPKCEYSVTIKDHNGLVIPNIDIYDADNVKLGTTDINGNIKFSYNNNHVVIVTKTTQDGYYINELLTGVSGKLMTKTVMATCPYGGDLRLGNIISVCNRDWILYDIGDNHYHLSNQSQTFEKRKYYLAATTILEETKFGSNNKYKGSILASRAMAYQNILSNQFPDIVNTYLANNTFEDVTAKVFAPRRNDLNGEYFNNDQKRICTYNGTPDWYWTSTSIDNRTNDVWYVTPQGTTSNNSNTSNVSNTYGFRPCISLIF